MRILYTALFTLGLPFILLRLLWRGFKAPAYWQRWPERFGKATKISSKAPVIWVHAVSFGEVEASRPLIKSLQAQYPKYRILITTMTPTGSQRVRQLFANTVDHCYLPYDLPFAINRFLSKTRPRLGIIMETELWPNILLICKKKNIPTLLANARMSERSAKGYARFADFTNTVLTSFSLLAAQSESDRQRLIDLGASSKQTHTVGNLKYDIKLATGIKEQAKAMREMWNKERPVLIAASTHEGEEQIILDAARYIRSKLPNLLLIIVPRHPERFDRVTALSQRSGCNTIRRSEHRPCNSDVEVFIVDTMGELPLFYACSDVSFVGGSLVPVGGHNLLEPAALGSSIMTGPHYFNFNEITELFISEKASVVINDTESLANQALSLLIDSQERQRMTQAAHSIIVKSQGASSRLINLIKFNIKL